MDALAAPFHPKYRADIDGLRAVAVLSVVAFHAFPMFARGGFIGVDIFFVISGFLISTIIYEGLDSGRFSFAEFYRRRIRRIFPSLLVVLLATLLLGWFLLLADEYQQLGRHVAAGGGFVSNFLLWSEAGYFDDSAEAKPLLHLWSLGIEEQFYILWPLMLWLAWKYRPAVSTVIAVAAAGSFALSLLATHGDAVAAFYSPQTRFWELLSGSILARIATRSPDAATSNGLSIAGFLLIAFGLLHINPGVAFPGVWAAVPVLGTCCIIAAGPQAWLNRHVLSNPIAVWFGLISYPLYLWHWPLLSFSNVVVGEWPTRNWRALMVLLSIILAWATYRLLERRIRTSTALTTVAVLCALMLVAVGAGLSAHVLEGYPSRAVVQRNQSFTSPVFDYASHWEGWQTCDIVTAPRAGDGGCRVLWPERPIDVVVIGDSHAGHLGSGLREQAREQDLNIAVMFHAGCFPVFPEVRDAGSSFACPGDVVAKALSFAARAPSVNTVVLSGYHAIQIQVQRLHEQPALSADAIAGNARLLERALRRTLDSLAGAQKRVVFLIDNPELQRNPRACIQRLGEKSCEIDISRREYSERNREFLEILARVERDYPMVGFASAPDALCDSIACTGYADGVLLYASRDHLSPAGSRRVVKALSPWLATASGTRRP